MKIKIAGTQAERERMYKLAKDHAERAEPNDGPVVGPATGEQMREFREQARRLAMFNIFGNGWALRLARGEIQEPADLLAWKP